MAKTEAPKKKPIVVVCVADQNNVGYAQQMITTLRKFHDWDVVLVTNVTGLNLPANVVVEDLSEYLKNDPAFFYRATPVLGEKYIKQYEIVLKIDADSLILGDLSYVLDTKDYDVAGVLNYNHEDAKLFPLVQGWGINPVEYFNCGFVAMRNEKFIHHWNVLCFSPQFDKLQYREQDLLNILVYYGNYNARCLDHGDGPANVHAWWGLISKGEWNKAIMKDGKVIIPQGTQAPPFPPVDTELKVIHWAGGGQIPKMNYKSRFIPEVVDYIDKLVS